MYKGWVGGWEGGWGWGWVGSRRRVTAFIRTQIVVLCLQYGTEMGTIHMIDRGGH